LLTCLFLRKFSVLGNVVAQVATWHEVYHKIQVLRVLKRKFHVNKETRSEGKLLVIKLREKFLFVHNGIHTALLNNSRLLHFLHREQLLLLYLFHLPHLPEPASAYYVQELERVLCHRSQSTPLTCNIVVVVFWLEVATSHINYLN